MWEVLLLQGVVSAERRSCGIYIAGRVHIDTKKRSCALRYIWEREFTCHCKSEALHLCWKSSKEEHVFSDRENPREVPAGNKAANVASVLGKKTKWNSLLPLPTWTGLFSRNVSKNPWITKSPSHTKQRLFIFQRDRRHNWLKSAC